MGTKMSNGIRVELTAEEQTAHEAAQATAQAYEQANAYKRNRQAEYPPIGDQLDYIYHNGIDAWKATIKVTKDKYPKP